MKLTDEQYLEIGRVMIEAYMKPAHTLTDAGRAAVAAVAPLLLSEPSDEEIRKVGSGHLWRGADFVRCKGVFRDRLASLTAKPDPAVEAVTTLMQTGIKHLPFIEQAERIVAAVDAARAK